MGAGFGVVCMQLISAHHDVVEHRQLGKGLGDLEGAHHATARDQVRGHAGDVLAVEMHATSVWRVKARHTGEESGFARAIGPDQGHDAAWVHRQAGVIHRAQATENFAQTLDLQHHRLPPGWPPLRRNKSIKPLGK